MSCENCTPFVMFNMGCCVGSGDVREYGTKMISFRRRDGVKIKTEACRKLVKFDDGTWGCEDYYDRPEVCKSFQCELLLRHR